MSLESARPSQPGEPTPEKKPFPLPIFSGARLKPDGTYVSPAHQALSELWTHEMERRHLPGILKRVPTTVGNETRIALRIAPKTTEDETLIENVRNRLEKGVMAWIHDGEPPYHDIGVLRKEYVTPLEIEK